MRVAIVLGFDDESRNALTQVFKRLEESKFTSYYRFVIPHITLATYKNMELQIALERLNQSCNNFDPFRVQFSSFGYFPSEESVLFLNPKANDDLLDIQQKVFELFEGFQSGSTPKTWVPHCTVALEIPLERIGQAIDIVNEVIVMENGAPFYVDAESIWTVEFQTDPLTVISTQEFKL